ncbi:MAG: TlpA disulfide reductase family protein [Nonlabens sp.]
MNSKFSFLIFLFCAAFSQAQEKKIWADSFLGKQAPTIEIEQWLSDEPNTEGKFILVDVWATWCGPCKRAIPKLNKFQKEFKDDLVIIGITYENERKVKKMTGPKMKYYNEIDTQKRMRRTLNVQGIPHCILIDPNGVVVWEGFPELNGHELTAEVIKDLIESYKS